MSYRAFKRLLGETSLERKCRFLFGTATLLLITASFYWYARQTEDLAYGQVATTGGLMVWPILSEQHDKILPANEKEFDAEAGHRAGVAHKREKLEKSVEDWQLAGMRAAPKPSPESTERIAEIAEILAAGVMRLRARQSSAMSADRGDSSLDCAGHQSGHANALNGDVE